MRFRWTVPIAAVLMAAGFLSVLGYTDDSEGVNDNFRHDLNMYYSK